MALVRKFTRRKKNFLTKIDNVHVNIIMVLVDINNSHVNIIILHVDIIYLACKGQKYATIQIIKKSLHKKMLFLQLNLPL